MYDAYDIISREYIDDIGADATLLVHRKTGARVALLSNNDENKVFNIAFRTPPHDSTGVAHIIEHTVLCGSEKFPVKDPFVELAKGSLNTFLNAMTYPDKTMYPAASCNDQDFKNLTEVYLDAVFYPNIYKTEKIFRQEGWHYHIEDPKDPLKLNGVVYNEMKGVFSSPDSILERLIYEALFPDTAYGVESGGDPKCIPDLTYEDYLDFHRKFYHPSNSYIYLYGNCDMEERLDWIDKEYLSKFDKIEVDSHIDRQKPFDAPVRLVREYPVLDDEPEEDNSYLNISTVVCDAGDVLTSAAFSILEYVLLDMPGAPLKQAILDAGIGKDVDGGYEDGILQNMFSVEVKFANPGDTDRFEECVEQTLEKLAGEGLDAKALEAAVNFYEFRFREADFGSYPKGLIYGMNMFDSWLYDDNKPFDHLKMLDVFAQLKKNIGTGYYEDLIRSRILGNSHKLILALVPKHGLAAQEEDAENRRLAEIKAGLTEEELDRMVSFTKELKEFQEAEDSSEALEKIPMLKRGDIDRKNPQVYSNIEKRSGDTLILHHDHPSNGIAYMSVMFDIDDIGIEEVPYLNALKMLLGLVDTEHYGYTELSNEINARTGGIVCGITSTSKKDGGDRRFFRIRAKYLYPEKDFVFDMIKEILLTSDLSSDKRLYELIAASKAQAQSGLAQAGHVTAVLRSLAGVSEEDAFKESSLGITGFRLIERLFADFDGGKEEFRSRLEALRRHIFRPEKMMVDITCDKDGLEGIEESTAELKKALAEYGKPGHFEKKAWEAYAGKEAFRTSGQVQFVATAGNFKDKGYEYNGALQILRVMMNYDYLWMNIRVKGGAYGCMSGFRMNGDSYLVSYRDPHIENTLKIYAGLPEYLRSYEADDKTFTKYIIGTISGLDMPKNAGAKGVASLDVYLSGVTPGEIQKEREQILDASPEDIRALADMLEDTLDQTRICVIGSDTMIEKHKDIFDTTENLIKA